MDITLLAIAAAVIVIGCILLAFFVFGTRERTFEDALAQQKGLGILLSTGQHAGKTTDKHKDKHKTHHDGGGGAKKKLHPPKPVESETTTSGVQTVQKKEKSEVHRQRSTASASAEEQENQAAANHDAAVGRGGSESSRSRQSSSGDGVVANLQKGKKAGKKQRRADVEDEVVVTNNSIHESDNQQGHRKADGELEQKSQTVSNNDASKEDGTILASSEAPSEGTLPKKAQKKKQKPTGGKQQQQNDGQFQPQEEKETMASGDHHYEKNVKPSSADASLLKQPKTGKLVGEGNVSVGDEHNLDVIIEHLKASPLTQAQVEFVLDALLNKQEHWSQGSQKGIQPAVLKKQLEEKEKALTQETQLVATVNQKLKELRQQLEAEKTRHVSSERSYHDQLSGKQRELQTSQQKVQELTTQCAQLSAQGRHAQDQLLNYRKMLEQAPNPTQIQQLREENQRAKERLSRNEQESHAVTTEIQRLRQEISQRDSQLQQAEQRFLHLQKTISMQESGQAQQLAEYQQKLTAKDVAYAQQEQELTNVRREWALLETSVRELRQQASLASQQSVGERNIRLQNAQQTDVGEVSVDKLNNDLTASKSLVASLEKRLADLDKELKESQTVSKRQKDQSQKEIKQMQDKLEQLEKRNTFNEGEIAKLTDSNLKRDEQLKKAQADARQFDTEKKARLAAENQIAKLQTELDSALKMTQDVKDSKSGSQGPAEEWQRRSAELEEKSRKLGSELEKMKEERRGLEQKIQNLLQENSKLSEQVAIASVNGHSEGVSTDALKIQEISLTHLNKQLIAKDGEITQLKQQLDQQRQKNSELRERNHKVVEAMNQLEKTSKDVTHKVETKYQKQLEEQEAQTKQALSKIIPDVKIPAKQSFVEWIKEVQRVVIERPKVVSVGKHDRVSDVEQQRSSKEVDQLKSQNTSLLADVKRYQVTLQQTEATLKSLEDVAAQHENRWCERVVKLENELSKAQAFRSVDLTSASVNESKDTETKLVSLRSSLEVAEKDRAALKTELDHLRRDLENERHSARDLSSQVVKLRGMLKTGQDALKQEQDLVSQLQKQLKAFQEGKGEHELHEELKELRTKLAQREQQLEREMMINKQLNNKLASLGVASPTAAAIGNSNGSL